MTIKIYCEECHGIGILQNPNPVLSSPGPDCPKCNGKGYREVSLDDLIVFDESHVPDLATAFFTMLKEKYELGAIRLVSKNSIKNYIKQSCLNLDLLK